jgi:hypothetical protein
MAAKKSNRYEIKVSKGGRNKNQFQWNKMRGDNTISFGIGYDTFQSCLKTVRSENKQRIKPLPIYHRGLLVV